MNRRNILSVFLCNYNHAKYLCESLDSILEQSHKANEIIIIDDASTDNSVEILKAYAGRYPEIRLICNKSNHGYIYNANIALQKCSGEYVIAVAADDVYLPGLFEKSLGLLLDNPTAGLCSSLSFTFDQEGKNRKLFPSVVIKRRPSYIPPGEVESLLMKYGSWFMGNTTIYRREAIIGAGAYIEKLNALADGFISQVIALKHGVCYLPEPLGIWRKTEEGIAISINRNPQRMYEILEYTKGLMQGKYNDTFSPGYVYRWERDNHFFLKKKLLKSGHNTKLQIISDDANIPSIKVYVYRTMLELKYIYNIIWLFMQYGSIRMLKNYINVLGFMIAARFKSNGY